MTLTEAGGRQGELARLRTDPGRAGSATAQRVFALLLDRILTFELKPFAEISEGGLAAELGVSRTPVREALARLGKLKLVDIFPQRGTMIAPLRVADLKRSQFLRESLEWGLLRRALKAPGRVALVETLRSEIVLQRTLVAIGDEARFYVSDELFHRLIAQGAGLPDIWGDISDAKLHMDRFRHLMITSVETLSAVVDQHQAIVDAIEAGDRGAAEAALKAHLRRIFAFLGRAFAAHPEYFEEGGPAIVDPAWFDD
jgi:DNA-binding GntR family transcriptional regulator